MRTCVEFTAMAKKANICFLARYVVRFIPTVLNNTQPNGGHKYNVCARRAPASFYLKLPVSIHSLLSKDHQSVAKRLRTYS